MIGNYKNYKNIIGVDEVGRGPLAGPVVAAAVMFKDANYFNDNIKDSKKLSMAKREKIFTEIKASAFTAVGIVSVEEIDKINILNAALLAMKIAVEDLNKNSDIILVDGNKLPDLNNKKSETIIKGDSKILQIAAASIIAKVTRDRIMENISKQFPQYLWHKNAGYGTKDHLKALQEFGPTIHHRKSFGPIKSYFQIFD